MNFFQLLRRNACLENAGVQCGWTGALRSRMLASSGKLSALRWLQLKQAKTQFFQVDWPPRERGRTWSIVSSLATGCMPQYWHVNRSRLKMLRRLNVTADFGSRSKLTNATISGTQKLCSTARIHGSPSSGAIAAQSAQSNNWYESGSTTRATPL